MSGRQDKKIRRIYNKDFKHRMDDAINDLYEQMRHIHKPAPRFFPKWLWRRLGRVFLNI